MKITSLNPNNSFDKDFMDHNHIDYALDGYSESSIKVGNSSLHFNNKDMWYKGSLREIAVMLLGLFPDSGGVPINIDDKLIIYNSGKFTLEYIKDNELDFFSRIKNRV